MVGISVRPVKSLVDEHVEIHISGLKPEQCVTLYAWLLSETDDVFESFAWYLADSNGEVNLDKQSSTGGSYVGMEPMGLFWGMKPSPTNRRKYSRLTKQDVCSPITVNISALDTHLRISEIPSGRTLTETFVERWYKSEGVQRVPVREGRVRGTLFIPDGKGPFPAVIDLFGTAGGLLEFRASLLASRGILALALAFFDYEDLPDLATSVELEYFEEAKEFLESQPSVLKPGIGVIGVSVGGGLALAVSTYIPGVTCGVILNGFVYASYASFSYKGKYWKAVGPNMNKMYVENNGTILSECWVPEEGEALTKAMINFQNTSRSFLFIFSGDDKALVNEHMRQLAEKMLLSGSRCKCKMITYPGAGHLLEPPHSPHAGITHTKLINLPQRWGGNTQQHAKAQEQAWTEMISFLHNELGGRSKI